LGIRFEPAPAAYGASATLPADLERLRAGKRERGGALVAEVVPTSPAVGTLWPGDLVLEIAGKPVFGDVPESFLPALLSLSDAAPNEVVVWRGGKRETLGVRAARGHLVYRDFQAEHDARAGARRP
jgi:S1-C subfamily serine protease